MLENTIHSIVGLARALFTVTGTSLGPFLRIDPHWARQTIYPSLCYITKNNVHHFRTSVKGDPSRCINDYTQMTSEHFQECSRKLEAFSDVTHINRSVATSFCQERCSTFLAQILYNYIHDCDVPSNQIVSEKKSSHCSLISCFSSKFSTRAGGAKKTTTTTTKKNTRCCRPERTYFFLPGLQYILAISFVFFRGSLPQK